jgi:hypothetical protein
MFLETADSVAMLGYAGLGKTAAGTEPSDWMSAVLRTRNLTLEESLGALTNAVRETFPEHLVQLSAPQTHTIVVPAFVSAEARLYTIDITRSPDRLGYQSRYTRHVIRVARGTQKPPRVGIAGSGALYLQHRGSWLRRLLQLVNAHDRGNISAYAVADYLAALNNDVHSHVTDASVGPRCIVSWRYNKAGSREGGGGHRFYTGERPDDSSPALPTIANGLDIPAIINLPHLQGMFADLLAGVPVREIKKEQIDIELATLPETPDEKLR